MRFNSIGAALGAAAVILGVSGGAFAQFTQGNIVVSRVGDGSAALSNKGTAVFLDQFTTTGAMVNSLALPTSVSGSNRRVVSSGTATSEGFLSRSTDGRYLVYGGYDADLGAGSSSSTGGNVGIGTGFANSIANTTAAAANRVVARIDSSGVVDSSTALTDAYSGNNIRSAATVDGTSFYTGGTSQGTPATGGVRLESFGGTTSTLISAAQNNVRVTNIFNNQLYYSTGSGTTGIYSVGAGLPNGSVAASTLIVASTSPYDFAFNAAGTVLYVADDTSGLMRYNLSSSGSVVSAYALTSTLVRGLTVDFSGTDAVVYATTATGASVIRGVDNTGGLTNFSVIATAGANTAFRDVVLAPFVASNGGVTPEPATLALFGVGAAPFAARLMRRRRRAA